MKKIRQFYYTVHTLFSADKEFLLNFIKLIDSEPILGTQAWDLYWLRIFLLFKSYNDKFQQMFPLILP
jgi:hypothetical protein